jgi:hypothetical protein
MTEIFSIIESPLHPAMSALYQRLGMHETRLTSVRKAIQELKKTIPDIVVADFIYGYGNNYAGVNVCNLDVFLHSLQKYKSDYRLIVLAEKEELQYVGRLAELFTIHETLPYPVTESAMQAAIDS